MGLKQLENAASAYSVVVSMAPTHLDARLTLADLLQQLGHHDDAIAILEAGEQLLHALYCIAAAAAVAAATAAAAAAAAAATAAATAAACIVLYCCSCRLWWPVFDFTS